MEQFNDIFVSFVQNDMIFVFLRVLYALGLLIFFIKGEVNVSKFVQTFSNLEQRYMLSKSGKVVEKPDLDDCQAEIQSHQDDCLSAFLDKYLYENQSIIRSQSICDFEAPADYEFLKELCGSCKADRFLGAYQGLQNLRTKYSIPEHFTDVEIVDYIEKFKFGKEVKSDEKKTVQKSEQKKLQETVEEDAQA